MSWYRATTPTHVFTFEVDPDATFKTILVTYSQGGSIILEKTKEDLTFEESTDCAGNTVYNASCTLTQAESNMFITDKVVEIQIRALTYYDEAVASEKMKKSIYDVLNDGVLT